MTISRGAAIAAVAASLITSACTPMQTKSGDEYSSSSTVHCAGVNSCKGKSECKNSANGCRQQNRCKGQGWTYLEYSDCLNQGGRVVD